MKKKSLSQKSKRDFSINKVIEKNNYTQPRNLQDSATLEIEIK